MLHGDVVFYNDRTFRRAFGSLYLLLRDQPLIAKCVGRDRGLCYLKAAFVEGLAPELLRHSAHPLQVAEAVRVASHPAVCSAPPRPPPPPHRPCVPDHLELPGPAPA